MATAIQTPAAGQGVPLAWGRLSSLRVYLAPVLAAVVWHGLLLAGYVLWFGGDPSALVCADRERIGRWPYEHVGVGFGTTGFDGQSYYTLARNPWRAHGEPIDLPPLRHARLLYPALAWLFSGGGDPVRLFWVLPALNLAAAAGLAGLGARLALHYGRSPWWGFVLPLVMNIGQPMLRDLTDPLAALAACGLLTAWLLRWHPAVVLGWGVAAVLSREQNAAVAMIVLLAALRHRHWRHAAALTAALLVFAGWVALLRYVYGIWPFISENLGLPLSGMHYRWTHLDDFPSPRSRLREAIALGILAVQIPLSLAVAFFRVNRSVKLVALSGALLAVVAGTGIYGDEWSFLRAFLWMPLGVWLATMASGRRWPVAWLTPMALWPCVAVLRLWLLP